MLLLLLEKVEGRTRTLKIKQKSSIGFILKQKVQVFLNVIKCHFTFSPISAPLLHFTQFYKSVFKENWSCVYELYWANGA